MKERRPINTADDHGTETGTGGRVRGMRGRLRRRSGKPLPGVKVLPTMMTLANLVCGFAAIYYSARAGESGGPTPFGWHPLTVAGVLVFLGMAFDAVDGSLARLTRSTSDLGAQLDSLADVVTFGVAPAFMMLRLVSVYYGGTGEGQQATILGPDAGSLYARLCWSIAAIYICCTALRLARFNVETASAAEDDHRWFKGLPSPGAGGAVSLVYPLPLLRCQEWTAVIFPMTPSRSSLTPVRYSPAEWIWLPIWVRTRDLAACRRNCLASHTEWVRGFWQ